MTRVIDRATSLVTTNEDLIRSVEGMECIMLEAVYQNYAGNLHRAWMAMHRAITVAQMMNLQRGLVSPSLKFLEPETRMAFNPAQTYFKLIQMDRYLSIMLGLPHTSLEDRLSTPQSLEDRSPTERMQRIHCAVAGRIIERTNGGINSSINVQEDDMRLRKAADEMEPKWWLVPNFRPCKDDDSKLLRDTLRIMDQLTHYHMLIRLHLPYIFSSSDEWANHSKMIAINASREILSRYIAFRASNPAHFYCRGCDFLAFIAICILCIAHINSRSQSRGSESSDAHAGFECLVHSRPSDRGSMECALEIIESMARDEIDLIAYKLTRIIHHLLTIEANAARGEVYSTSPKGDDGGLEYDGRLTDNGKILQVHIPYFGAITFERGVISKAVKTLGQHDLKPSTMPFSNVFSPSQPSEDYQQPPFGYDVMSMMGYPYSGTRLSSAHQVAPPGSQHRSDEQNAEFFDSMEFLRDQSDLQGIDAAFFDGLFCGSETGGNIEDP
ncbi:uncharacterized protein N7511_009988 [Penicillium nucicola]|uniref:uncharacterized protein n=1 Tax=Penicillium nucicola TaxID=1850975 RepID=UPI002545867E|nr:uncharacterized protein N7511_009988 [Penicillium nucicola]KAJ5748292.1 hypothetical protein N7511_009988 [Penicillium nucicola]